MQVDMRVDAARHDDAPAGVNFAYARLAGQRTGSGHCSDGLTRDRDIANRDALGRDNVTSANDDVEHFASGRVAFWGARGDPTMRCVQYRL